MSTKNPHELIEPSAFARSFLDTIARSHGRGTPDVTIVDRLVDEFSRLQDVSNIRRFRQGCDLALEQLASGSKTVWHQTGIDVLRSLKTQVALGSTAANRVVQAYGGPSPRR